MLWAPQAKNFTIVSGAMAEVSEAEILELHQIKPKLPAWHPEQQPCCKSGRGLDVLFILETLRRLLSSGVFEAVAHCFVGQWSDCVILLLLLYFVHPCVLRVDSITVEKGNDNRRVIIINNWTKVAWTCCLFKFVFNVCTEPQSSGVSPGNRETNRMYLPRWNSLSWAEEAGERLYKHTGRTHLCLLMSLCNA